MEKSITHSCFDIQRMSKESNIPISQIKSRLGLPLEGICDAATIKEAQLAYKQAPNGSESEDLALEKWMELITTIEQAQEAYKSTPIDSWAKRLAFQKWMKLITTIEQAQEAYKSTSLSSEAEGLTIKKIASFYGYTEEKEM